MFKTTIVLAVLAYLFANIAGIYENHCKYLLITNTSSYTFVKIWFRTTILANYDIVEHYL
jgi:hypothetical protein